MAAVERCLGTLLCATALAAIAGSTASAATPPKRWYWSEPRAESFVLQKVKIPECWVWEDSRCTNPPGPFWANGGSRMPVASADCAGRNEKGTTFTFNRFVCKIVVNDGNGIPAARGTIAVWPTGATTLRWKPLG